MKISYYPRITQLTPTEDLSFIDYLQNIRSGKWQDVVLAVRTGKAKKVDSPLVTVSGRFSERKNNGLIEHSGILAIDIDTELTEAQTIQLKNDQYTYAMHRSIGGGGWVVYVKIDPKKHLESFICLQKYYADMQVVIDRMCKDIVRARFISYDPDLISNPSAATWKDFNYWKYYEKKQKELNNVSHYIIGRQDIDSIISQLNERQVDLTSTYETWLEIAFSLVSEFGEGGRSYFHAISKINYKYNARDCEDKYDNCLRTGSGEVTIATLFYYCKQNDIKVVSEKTREIIQSVANNRKTGGTKGNVLEQVKKYNDIDPSEDVQQIIDKAWKKPLPELDKNLKGQDQDKDETQLKLDQLEFFLKTNYEFRYNIVSNRVEYCHVGMMNFEQITDEVENTIYLRFVKSFGLVSRSIFDNLVRSDFSKEYNPILDYLEQLEASETGELQKLFECINVSSKKYPEKINGLFFYEYFITKWLVGCVSSIYGTHSVLMLILIGAQRTRKTKFFRLIVPEKLRKKYVAEEAVTGDKDSLIMLTEKWIIVDNEMVGKINNAQIKSLLDKEYISVRKPFGKNTITKDRIACMAATANETDILSDLTGNRRLLPVEIESIDEDKLKQINPDKLWSEVKHIYQTNKEWFLDDNAIDFLNRASEINRDISTEEEILLKYYSPCGFNDKELAMTASEIIIDLQGRTNGVFKLNPQLIGRVMKKYNFAQTRISSNGIDRRVWYVKENAKPMEDMPF